MSMLWSRESRRAAVRNATALVACAAATTMFTLPAAAHSRRIVRAAVHAPASAPNIIIDTDLSRWWDDVTAIGIANVLQQHGRLHILGIMSDVRNPVAVAAIDAIDTAYGHPDIPIGAVAHSSWNTAAHGYSDMLARRLPHSVRSSADVPDAVLLYRRLLEHQPDHSVTVVSIGGYSNLAGLLRTRGASELITRTVRRLVIMDGLFPNGGPPFTNQLIDLEASRIVVAGGHGVPAWPTPIGWVDGFDGIATEVGGTLCTAVPERNPMRLVYETLFGCGPPGDGDWDAPALLFAVADSPRLFTELGRGGAAVINDSGGLSWLDSSPRRHDYYVHVVDQAGLNARIDELLTTPASGQHATHR